MIKVALDGEKIRFNIFEFCVRSEVMTSEVRQFKRYIYIYEYIKLAKKNQVQKCERRKA